ncbi:MAG: hypothetical protein V8S97_05820 [Oscillospiraceae bacterium]
MKDTDTELFLALDDAGNIWTMNVYPTVDEKTGKDTWGASFGIISPTWLTLATLPTPPMTATCMTPCTPPSRARNWFCTWPTSPATPAMSTASS